MRISDWSSDVCSSDLVRPRSSAGWQGQSAPGSDRKEFGGGRLSGRRSAGLYPRSGSDAGRGVGGALRRDKGQACLRPKSWHEDRKSVVLGTIVSVRLVIGGSSIIKKKQTIYNTK